MRRWRAWAACFHAAAATTIGATGRPLPPLQPLSPAAPAGTLELCRGGRAPLGHGAQPRAALGRRRCSCAPSTPSPAYELYALPGGPPERPGLVRVAAGTGHAIATEVWALPAEGFARFVAGIPAPLGIGTLLLADGTRPKGFLCEAEAIRAASNISSFGGWRAYLAAKG